MSKHSINETGFAHYMLLVAGVAVVVIASGYLVYTHRSHNVSLSGTLSKNDCTSNSSCSQYSLESGNRSYNLNKLSSLPSQVSPGSSVSVTGTSSSANPSQVTVNSITPKSGGSSTGSTNTSATPSKPIQPIYPHDVTFSSTVATDTCSSVDNPSGPPVGDAGCSITAANGWTVQVRRGNINDPTPPGALENAPAYNQSWKGKQVSIYAQATAQNESSILSASKYYVKF